eukprot:PhM_4_TR7293/c0_g1_i1/m.87609
MSDMHHHRRDNDETHEGEEDEDDVDFLREIVAQLSTEREDLQQQVIELEIANRALSRQVQDLREAAAAAAAGRDSDAVAEARALKAENKLMAKQAVEDVKRVRAAESRQNELEAENIVLRRKLGELEHNQNDLSSDATSMVEANGQLAQRLSEALEELDQLRSHIKKLNSEDFQSFYLRKCNTVTHNSNKQFSSPSSPSLSSRVASPTVGLQPLSSRGEQPRTPTKQNMATTTTTTPTPTSSLTLPALVHTTSNNNINSSSLNVSVSTTTTTTVPSPSSFQTQRAQRGIERVLGEKGERGTGDHMYLVQYKGRSTQVWQEAEKVAALSPQAVESWEAAHNQQQQ